MAFVDRCNTLLLVVDQRLARWENTVLIACGNETPPKPMFLLKPWSLKVLLVQCLPMRNNAFENGRKVHEHVVMPPGALRKGDYKGKLEQLTVLYFIV